MDRKLLLTYLEKGDLEGLLRSFPEKKPLFRPLLSLTFDKDSVVSWRAIEAIGLIAGELIKKDPETVRGHVQKQLWMMRDESGNNPGSAPEIVGEIVRNCPDQFPDIAPILTSFLDEEMLKKGLLRALWRIADISPDLCGPLIPVIGMGLRDPDPTVRAYAILLAGAAGVKEFQSSIESLGADESAVKIYRGGQMHDERLNKIAEETVIMLRTERAAVKRESPTVVNNGGDAALKCPFCERAIEEPRDIRLRFGGFTGGECPCGAVYAYDRSGHNLGDTYVDALGFACSEDVDVWTLSPGEDYEIREMTYDKRKNRLVPGARKGAAAYLFILVRKEVARDHGRTQA